MARTRTRNTLPSGWWRLWAALMAIVGLLFLIDSCEDGEDHDAARTVSRAVAPTPDPWPVTIIPTNEEGGCGAYMSLHRVGNYIETPKAPCVTPWNCFTDTDARAPKCPTANIIKPAGFPVEDGCIMQVTNQDLVQCKNGRVYRKLAQYLPPNAK